MCEFSLQPNLQFQQNIIKKYFPKHNMRYFNQLFQQKKVIRKAKYSFPR